MPIFMDRHDVNENVTAKNVAELHQEDLKIQDQYGCKGLTYWFDEDRKTAFCLVEASNKEAVMEMHKHAHGEIPHKIIEVDPLVVESFLGRIEDPEKARDTELNIIDESAYRAIMVVALNQVSFNNTPLIPYNSFLGKHSKSMVRAVAEYKGRLVSQKMDAYLVSFTSVNDAIECALSIKRNYSALLKENKEVDTLLKIAINAGMPVTEDTPFFDEAIKAANRMCEIDKSTIIIASEVKAQYENEKLSLFNKNKEDIYCLSNYEERFLNKLMSFTEKRWKDGSLQVDDFNEHLGCSKSQLYRKTVALVGKSPSLFLKEFRLKKALQLLNKKEATVSEVSYMVGFSSPSYFTKCFQKKYGLSPSSLLQDPEN